MKSAFRLALVAVAVAALAFPIAAQQADNQTAANPLVQLLQSKGILSPEEAANVRSASTTTEANERLARLLWSKGLISQQEYNSTVAASAASAAATGSSGARMVNAAAPAAPASAAEISATPDPPRKMAEWPVSAANIGYDPSDGASADAGTIPAVAPVRVLPITLPKDPKGIIPDIKLGSGAMLNVYGFLKASAVYDTTNSGGTTFGNNDFPLPLLLGDTGPQQDQFRIKARSTRAGVNFYYPINGPDITLTGKMEFDWEGDYTAVNNRNISGLRSNQLSLRLAWARLDAKLGSVPWFAEFGQDWTLLGSSTVMDLFETTGFAVGYGNFYERLPQFKTGLQFTAGRLKIEPEFAIVLSDLGDANLNNASTISALGAVGVITSGQNIQEREGAILGTGSGQPGVQGRLVFDFPLNQGWKGVPNAEIIFSGGHSEGAYDVPLGNIPTTGIYSIVAGAVTPTLTTATLANTINPNVGVTCTGAAPATGFSIRCYYPNGVDMTIPNNAFSAEIQLPTPWFTVVSKYYRGADLRFMFGGILTGGYRATTVGPGGAVVAPFAIPGGTNIVTCTNAATCSTTLATSATTVTQAVLATSGDPVTFSAVGGSAVVDPYRPIRGQGGLIQLSFPLSRIFGANPEGLNSGWQLFAAYGIDSAFARDNRNSGAALGGNGLNRTDYVPVSLRYRINRWAQIVNEVTWYDTRTADKVLVPVNGVNAHVNHDIREEFGTIFTF